MRTLFLACAALAVTVPSCAAQAETAATESSYVAADARMSVEQVRRDVMLAKEAFSRIHPGYTRYASLKEMDAAWAKIIAQAEASGSLSLPEFYLAVELALTTIRCDHTKAELPRSLRAERVGKPLYLPFRWQVIEGRGLIENASEGLDLARGDEILTIDDKPLSDILSMVAPFIPIDGYTEWSRTGGLSQSLEFMGGAVDHFGMYLWDTPGVARLTVRNAEGVTREVSVPRISFKEWTALGGTRAANFKDAVAFRRVGERAGYLKIDTFVNYRQPVDPATIYEPIFAAMAQEGRDTLILDLRENGGGSSDAAQGLAAYLIEESQQLKRSIQVATLDLSGVRQHLSSWEPQALDPDPRAFITNDDGSYTLRDGIVGETAVFTPEDNAFDGRLIVLTSNNNSSGSTNLLTILAQQERTTLIGEPTGGSAEGPTAGIQFILTLPESGIRARLPIFRYRNNVDQFERGFGVSPDIAAPMTVAAFREARDPALERAQALARTNYVSEKTTTSNASGVSANIADFAPIEGEDWTGELEYLNYGREDRSIIPVRMVARAPTRHTMAYGFIYPGEESKNARDRLKISRDGTRINGMKLTARYVDHGGALVLVTQAKGRDDNRPADIRVTYVIAKDSFVTRKDVRFDDGEFFNRNEYRLTR